MLCSLPVILVVCLPSFVVVSVILTPRCRTFLKTVRVLATLGAVTTLLTTSFVSLTPVLLHLVLLVNWSTAVGPTVLRRPTSIPSYLASLTSTVLLIFVRRVVVPYNVPVLLSALLIVWPLPTMSLHRRVGPLLCMSLVRCKAMLRSCVLVIVLS